MPNGQAGKRSSPFGADDSDAAGTMQAMKRARKGGETQAVDEPSPAIGSPAFTKPQTARRGGWRGRIPSRDQGRPKAYGAQQNDGARGIVVREAPLTPLGAGSNEAATPAPSPVHARQEDGMEANNELSPTLAQSSSGISGHGKPEADSFQHDHGAADAVAAEVHPPVGAEDKEAASPAPAPVCILEGNKEQTINKPLPAPSQRGGRAVRGQSKRKNTAPQHDNSATDAAAVEARPRRDPKPTAKVLAMRGNAGARGKGRKW